MDRPFDHRKWENPGTAQSRISSGAAVGVAVRLADEADFAGKNIVVVLPDSGERHISSMLFEGNG